MSQTRPGPLIPAHQLLANTKGNTLPTPAQQRPPQFTDNKYDESENHSSHAFPEGTESYTATPETQDPAILPPGTYLADPECVYTDTGLPKCA